MDINPNKTNTFKAFIAPPKITNRKLNEIPCNFCVKKDSCPNPAILSRYCLQADVLEQPCYLHEDEKIVDVKRFYPSSAQVGIGKNLGLKGKFVELVMKGRMPFSRQEMDVFIDGRKDILPKKTRDNVAAVLDYIGKTEYGISNMSQTIRRKPTL